MNKDLALKIAAIDENITKTSDLMQRANQIFGANQKINYGNLPFSNQEIVFAKFIDYVQETATQREKDLLITSEFLSKCWSKMHIGVATLGEKFSESEKKDMKALVASLRNLNLLSLLTDGLNKKTLIILNDVCDNDLIELFPAKEPKKNKLKNN